MGGTGRWCGLAKVKRELGIGIIPQTLVQHVSRRNRALRFDDHYRYDLSILKLEALTYRVICRHEFDNKSRVPETQQCPGQYLQVITLLPESLGEVNQRSADGKNGCSRALSSTKQEHL